MLKVDDPLGEYRYPTFRALVIAVGEDVTGINRGDLVWLDRNEIDFRTHENVSVTSKPNMRENPNAQKFTTYKEWWTEEGKKQLENGKKLTGNVWASQVERVEDSPESFMFKD